jgi:hypothetical protein
MRSWDFHDAVYLAAESLTRAADALGEDLTEDDLVGVLGVVGVLVSLVVEERVFRKSVLACREEGL